MKTYELLVEEGQQPRARLQLQELVALAVVAVAEPMVLVVE